MDRQTIEGYIDAIEKNYPPSNYTHLREALDYCLYLLRMQYDVAYQIHEAAKEFRE